MSIQPRKQRKAMYDAPLHKRRKQIASHLSEELLLKYNVRRTPVITGDQVRILRGDNKGKTGKIVGVDTKKRRVVVEGITHKKADGTDVALPLDASNLLITRLNLEDKRRRAKLGETEAPKESKPKATKAAASTQATKAAAGTEDAKAAAGTADVEPAKPTEAAQPAKAVKPVKESKQPAPKAKSVAAAPIAATSEEE